MTRGAHLAGGVDDLAESDDQYVLVEARKPSRVSEPSVRLLFDGDTGDRALYALEFRLEAATVLDGVFRQRIQFYR